jgi:hypothetical protein
MFTVYLDVDGGKYYKFIDAKRVIGSGNSSLVDPW